MHLPLYVESAVDEQRRQPIISCVKVQQRLNATGLRQRVCERFERLVSSNVTGEARVEISGVHTSEGPNHDLVD